ncbi:aminotransferase class V-fold PLP-dependent enzyme [Candidatus Bathyarchaeota archaeon]|nr:aminotransferase class V-fold PLP-dependent enzyme [Candidatus Bathyarchaeota archaeon]
MKNERELLMIPGPTIVSPRVLRALVKPVLSHVSSEFVEGYAEALDLQKKLFMTEGTPFLLSGSGTLGMEAAVANLLEKGDKVLCVENGYFGEKWEEIVETHGGIVDRLRFNWGDPVDVKQVEEKLSSNEHKMFTVEHVDTSTGIANPLEEIGELRKSTEALYIVDSVCGIGGMPLRMDEWNIDFALTGSQKALGAPPGISLFCLNDIAWDVVENRSSPPSDYYVNLKRWKPIMDNPRGYFATPAVGMVLAMLESMKIIFEEGLENRWRRHKTFSEAFMAGVNALGMEAFPAAGHNAHTLTVPKIPEGVDDAKMRSIMNEKYQVIIAGGLGKLGGKTVRVGHMGNDTMNDLVSTLGAMEMALAEMGHIDEPGKAVGELMKIFISN